MVQSWFTRLGFAVLALAFFTPAVCAQIRVVLAVERSTHLLYEPMEVAVQITNTTDEPLVLNTRPGERPWLSFIVKGADGNSVRTEQTLELEPLAIPPGEAKLLSVDLTPLYAIRTTGPYRVQASVQVPGRTAVLTDPLVLTVGAGDTLWTKSYSEAGTQRVVSLIRFMDRREVTLYLRVEEPRENLVYSTTRLGPVVAFTQPQVLFDKGKGIHILQPVSPKTYRYTRADKEGRVLEQVDREAAATQPTLAEKPGGEVALVGGMAPPTIETRRPKLSAAQQGL